MVATDNTIFENSLLINISPSTSNLKTISVETIIVLLWVMGTLAFLFRFLLNTLSIVKIKKTSIKVSKEWQDRLERLKNSIACTFNVQLHYSTTVVVPMVLGVLEPVIILPLIYFNKMTIDELESILIHELVHVQRRDFLFNIIQHIVESFMFFNPATWWMSGRIHRYREYCCDDEVQREMGANRSYLSALYKVACHSIEYRTASVALIKNKSELIMRVKRMLNKSREELSYKPILSAIALSLVVFFSFQYISSGDEKLQNLEEIIDLSEINLSEEIDFNPVFQLNRLNELKAEVQPGLQTFKDKPTPANQTTTIANRLPLQEIIDINNHKELSLLSLHHSSEKMRSMTFVSDTLPSNPKIRELEELLEQKTEELEELTDQLSEEMEESIELEIEKMEELVEQLEKVMEPKMEALEEEMNEEELERIE